MSNTYPGPLDEAAFGALILLRDVASLESLARINQNATSNSTFRRLVQ